MRLCSVLAAFSFIRNDLTSSIVTSRWAGGGGGGGGRGGGGRERKNGGTISRMRLTRLLTRVGEKLSKHEIDELLDDVGEFVCVCVLCVCACVCVSLCVCVCVFCARLLLRETGVSSQPVSQI